MRVIDLLEIIEVDKHQGDLMLIAPGCFHRLPQSVIQQASIGQVGERVIQSHVQQLGFIFLAVGDVELDRHIVGYAILFIGDRGKMGFLPEDIALLVMVDEFADPWLALAQILPKGLKYGIAVQPRTQ